MVEDQYLIVLANELDLAWELRNMARDDHGNGLAACLNHILYTQGVRSPALAISGILFFTQLLHQNSSSGSWTSTNSCK